MTRKNFVIQDLGFDQVTQEQWAIGDVYRAAFKVENDPEIDRFVRNALLRHATYQQFHLAAARATTGEIVGFVYVYRSLPGHWWRDQVGPALEEHGFAHFLDDTFEFVEFAVRPEFQGIGIGTALHDHILKHVPARYAVLSTGAGDNPAHEMYLHRGWVDLVPEFLYPGAFERAVLMGIDLDLWRARTSYNGANTPGG